MFRVEPGHGGATSFVPLAVFAVENLLLVGTLGFTVGHRLLGLRVLSMTGRRASLVQVLVRTLLLCLAIPALIWDRDGRGLHDKAAGTLIVRAVRVSAPEAARLFVDQQRRQPGGGHGLGLPGEPARHAQRCYAGWTGGARGRRRARY
jgi:hypothetical protein